MKRISLLGLAIAFVAMSRVAMANGRYPAGSQLVIDPNNRQHVVVSATFGVLESRDGGRTFGWMCEAAIGTSGQQDLMLAITGNSTTVVAMYNGITTTTDGCGYRAAPELAGRTVMDLAGSKSSPHDLIAFWLEFKTGGTFASQIVHSSDDGSSWAEVGPPLASDFYPLTVDYAPSRFTRVYLSGRADKSKNFGSVLMRSDDGGATFETFDIPGTEEHRLSYIAAVHPTDPDRVYIRVYEPDGTTIQMTSVGGRTFQKIFTGSDQLYGFAISPDGTQIALGGPGDGIWIGAADGTNLTRRSDVGANCLTWTPDALYVCADYKSSGFSIGRSTDAATTFEPLFRFDWLCGRATCGNNNTTRCSEEWGLIAPQIGAKCDLDASVGDDDGGDGSGGTGSGGTGGGGAGGSGAAPGRDASSSPDAATGGASGDGTGTTMPPSSSESDGCSLVTSRSKRSGHARSALMFVIAAIAVATGRRRPAIRRARLASRLRR